MRSRRLRRADTVIVAVPLATAVARPVAASTVAIDAAEVDHVKILPATAFPFPSFATAENCSVPPITFNSPIPGVTSIVAVTGATDSDAAPCTPSVVAVIVAVPFVTAVATLDTLTVTTVMAELLQMKDFPKTAFPLASLASRRLTCSPTSACVRTAAYTKRETG
jgi:hypothetical protein